MDTITAEQLLALERSQRYKRQLADADVFPDKRNWRYIIDNAMSLLAPQLYRKFLLAWMTPEKQRSDYHDLAIEFFPEYLLAIPREEALAAVYADVTSSPDATLHIIDVCRLFDAEYLISLLDEGADERFVAQCLVAYQPSYSAQDVAAMTALVKKMRNLPELGSIRLTQSIFGRDRRFICPNGHTSAIAADTAPSDCYCDTCGLNIQGLTSDDVDAVATLSNRIALLKYSGLDDTKPYA